MANYETPGVYVEEISIFPPSVAQVETAIPAFIGYTEKAQKLEEDDLLLQPQKISSMVEFETLFGGPSFELPDFTIASGNITHGSISSSPVYKMYYMLQMYFANGGGPCYIISTETYHETPAVNHSELRNALEPLKKEDEPTLILFPDAQSISDEDQYYGLYKDALNQCGALKDRFVICDVKPAESSAIDPVEEAAETFRTKIGTNYLSYGAAYFPNLKTSLSYQYPEEKVIVNLDVNTDINVLRHPDSEIDFSNPNDPNKIASLYHADNGQYRDQYYKIKKMIEAVHLELPSSAAVAGIYARVDENRGVWKAPANVSLNRVVAPTILMMDEEQKGLNVDSSGKSINAIRKFTGRGNLVWGARTMDGNSNEWRYIPVRRFFNMVEESCKEASFQFVFEPNDANTWVKVKAMIENFLILQWRAGALMGAKPEEAFFVKVGLGKTMTQEDVNNGKMNVEIGMAVVRPAEFIILRFSHKMLATES